jgi:hypothetical protein
VPVFSERHITSESLGATGCGRIADDAAQLCVARVQRINFRCLIRVFNGRIIPSVVVNGYTPEVAQETKLSNECGNDVCLHVSVLNDKNGAPMPSLFAAGTLRLHTKLSVSN